MSYDLDVVAATSGHGEASWDKIIKLCNRIRDSFGLSSMQQAMMSVMKRVKHSDPNVQLHALTLLEACVSNCGKDFQLELTKQTFQTDVRTILTGPYSDPRVTQRLKELLVSWINEYKGNQQMSGLQRFVESLQKDGVSFQSSQQSSAAVTSTSSSGTQSKEEDDLQKAIRLSLQHGPANPTSSTPSLYPSMPAPSPQPTRKKKVRAVYDFTAAEDNELSFRAGEIITVQDDSDENWWRGETQLGTGLFPASFVSTNLSVDPEPSKVEKEKKKSKKSGTGKKAKVQKVVVNEEKVELLLEMLKGADVTIDDDTEGETIKDLEEECKKMRPAVEESIAALQRQEDEMQTVTDKFQEALAMYRKLLAEGPRLSGATPQPLPSIPPPTSQSLSQSTHPQPPPYQPTPLPTGSFYTAEPPSLQPLPLDHTHQAPPTQPQTQQGGYLQQAPTIPQQQQPWVSMGTSLVGTTSLTAQSLPPPYQSSFIHQPYPSQQTALVQQPLL